MKRETNSQKRARLKKERAKTAERKLRSLLPSPFKGGSLSRRVLRRREVLGLARLDDHLKCLSLSLGRAIMMHWAKEQGFRDGHLAGYDAGLSAGIKKCTSAAYPNAVAVEQ